MVIYLYNMAITKTLALTLQAPFRIGVMLIDGFALMSYASVVEPLRAANLLASKDLFQVSHFSATGLVARSSGGAIVETAGSVDTNADFELFLVVAGGDPHEFIKPPVASMLRRLDRRGVTLGGVSGGPVVLAAAGLMENRRMTVHWEHAPMLAALSDNLMVERSLYVIDRDRVTCAGGIAPMDMMHALIAKEHGSEFARLVSDWFLHTEIRPSSGSQRSSLIERYGINDPNILDAIEIMRTHIGDPLQLSQIASLTRVSARQLNRVFGEKTGQSIMNFYRNLRLEYARNLLRNSSMPLTEIALATGFSSSAHFSKSFASQFGGPPSVMRRNSRLTPPLASHPRGV
jgi:transcriptional regulator GlxA family with amidase domain